MKNFCLFIVYFCLLFKYSITLDKNYFTITLLQKKGSCGNRAGGFYQFHLYGKFSSESYMLNKVNLKMKSPSNVEAVCTAYQKKMMTLAFSAI